MAPEVTAPSRRPFVIPDSCVSTHVNRYLTNSKWVNHEAERRSEARLPANPPLPRQFSGKLKS
jgi:hypothetical protein